MFSTEMPRWTTSTPGIGLVQFGEYRRQLHERVAGAGGQVGERGADGAVVVDVHGGGFALGDEAIGDRLAGVAACVPTASDCPEIEDRRRHELSFGLLFWCDRGARSNAESSSAATLAGRRRCPLKSAPSYAMNSTVAPRDLAIAIIRSMSSPELPGIPLTGGSGKAAPTLSVSMESAWLLEFCSSLVDLVIRIGRNCRRGHRFTLAGERVVFLVAEDLAKANDRGAELGNPYRRHWTDGKARNGGGRFVVSEPDQNHAARAARGTRIVEIFPEFW